MQPTPADRTVAVAALSVSPESFLRVFYAYLREETQKLIMNELREVGETPEDVFDDLGSKLIGDADTPWSTGC